MLPRVIFKILLCIILFIALKLFRSLYIINATGCKDKFIMCPHIMYFVMSGLCAVGIIIVRHIFCKISAPLGNYLIQPRYAPLPPNPIVAIPGRHSLACIRKFYRTSATRSSITVIKISRFSHHMFRCLYYLLVTLWGYNILQPEASFPSELGGSFFASSTYDYSRTWLMAKLTDLSPRSLQFMSWYFRTTLGFQLASVFILIREPFLSEQSESVVQLVLGVTLVVLGYMANHLFIGACLLLMHDSCDILTAWCQAWVNTRYKLTTFFSAITLLAAFAYLRLFCFAKLLIIPIIYAIENEKLNLYESSHMICFAILLLCLLFMNIYWFSMLVKSCFVFVIHGRITDAHSPLTYAKKTTKVA